MQARMFKTASVLLLLALFAAPFMLDDVYQDAAHLLQEIIFFFCSRSGESP